MYEELIGRLRICGKTCDGNCTPFGCRMQYTELVEATHSENLYRVRCTAEDAADAIEDLSREIDIDNAAMTAMHAAMPRWIPATERFPEENMRVIGFMAWKGITAIEFQNGKWYSVDHLQSLPDEAVTHWMPLPPPPKGE